MDKYIGFDISDKKTVACIYDPETRKSRFDTLPTNSKEMKKWLENEKQPGDRIHLTFEVCGMAGHLHDSLSPSVDSLTVSNPHRMTWIYRTAKKNDRFDAQKQAKLLAFGEIPKVHMPRAEVREWRQMIQHRKRLVQKRTATKNQIRALLKSNGQKTPDKGSLWTRKNMNWLRMLSREGQRIWHLQLSDLLDQLDMQSLQICRITKVLDDIGSKNAQVQLLQTIPGIGPRTAEAIVAYVDNVDRFRTGKKFAAYFGMVPTLDESGDTRRVGHITKRGPSVVRCYLTEGCWMTIKKSPKLKAFHERITKKTGHKNVATIAVARKLLTIMRAMLKNGEEFNEELV